MAVAGAGAGSVTVMVLVMVGPGTLTVTVMGGLVTVVARHVNGLDGCDDLGWLLSHGCVPESASDD